MILSPLQGNPDAFDQDPLPRLCAATDRLRRLAAREAWKADPACRLVIGEVLGAAVQAEQSLAIQRARIRYLESLSITDELTGLLNRRGFRLELNRALAGARRRKETGLLLLCDLDHFKAINDSYGHMTGDAVLRAVAGLLLSRTRRSDYVARLGGDEFAVLMTHSTEAQAERRVATLARLINSLVVERDGHGIPISASIGFEGYHENSQPETLLFLADRALYRTKRPRLVETGEPAA
ncbi:MAG: GGDEF domain-containing protein [Kiloniellaceae bacterium]